MLTENFPKIPNKFFCENCNFNTSRKSHYEKHLLTQKHKYLQNNDAVATKKKYVCDCGKEYNYRQSLYNHRKTCKGEKKENIIIQSENKDEMKQEEFAKLMSECGKSIDDGREKIIKKLCDNVYIEKVE